MKLLYKILLCTIIIMAVAFGLSGYLFVNFVFETALEREIGQALDDSDILRFAFETAALNVPTKYNVLQDIAVEQIGSKLESSGASTGRFLRISREYGAFDAAFGECQDMGDHISRGKVFYSYGHFGQCPGSQSLPGDFGRYNGDI